MTSPLDIPAIRAAHGKTTRGDWQWDRGLVPPDGPHRYADIYVDGGEIIIASFNDLITDGIDNAAFIVAAHTQVPALCDKVERLEADNADHHPTASVEAVARIIAEEIRAENGSFPGYTVTAGRIARRLLALTSQQPPALEVSPPTEGPEKGVSGSPQERPSLSPTHQDTFRMLQRFSEALADKLARAELKYGYTNGWLTDDWEDECRRQLREHADKGDPLDVAAYAAFCWARGWSTASARQLPSIAPPRPGVAKTAAERRRLREVHSSVSTERVPHLEAQIAEAQTDHAEMLAGKVVMSAAALAELEAEVARLREAVMRAIVWFEDYNRQHLAKAPPDLAKAATNEDRAEYLRAALEGAGQ